MSYAFFSVSDKTGIENVAKVLVERGVKLISTGGTRNYLEKSGFQVIPIETITNKPEAFQGRMKSISFEMASGILFRRHDTGDRQEASDLNIPSIDYVIINFYPFIEESKKSQSLEDLIDYIDIGGPSLLRAAAKNFNDVSVLSSSNQYARFIEEMQAEGKTSLSFRKLLAGEAFTLSAAYDQAIVEVFNGIQLRYGENPHQQATAVLDPNYWRILQDTKELSYNNYLDAHHAWSAILDFTQAFPQLQTALVIKHNNPCGIASNIKLEVALKEAWEGDPVSAFGGVLAFSSEFNELTAKFLQDKFVEVIIAPSFSGKALEMLKTKKNLRILQAPLCRKTNEKQRSSILGGYLQQDVDALTTWKIKWTTQNRDETKNPVLNFAFLAAKQLKSNALVLARATSDGFQMLSAGMGQPNRIDCLKRLAIPRLEDYFPEVRSDELVLASDAFFPFSDIVEVCADYGIKTIIQPGGSLRDEEIVQVANEKGIAMAFTNTRHFKH